MPGEVNTDQIATLLVAKELFLRLHQVKLGLGNSSRTKCDVFTARADGELWPSLAISMMRMKQLAKVYKASGFPVRFERISGGLKVDATSFKLE